jgi:hypothetical protein
VHSVYLISEFSPADSFTRPGNAWDLKVCLALQDSAFEWCLFSLTVSFFSPVSPWSAKGVILDVSLGTHWLHLLTSVLMSTARLRARVAAWRQVGQDR